MQAWVFCCSVLEVAPGRTAVGMGKRGEYSGKLKYGKEQAGWAQHSFLPRVLQALTLRAPAPDREEGEIDPKDVTEAVFLAFRVSENTVGGIDNCTFDEIC